MFPFDDHSTGIGTRYAVCVVVCGGPRAVTRASRGGVTFPARMTLPPYSNAPFAKARVRCSRVCAGAESGVCPSPPRLTRVSNLPRHYGGEGTPLPLPGQGYSSARVWVSSASAEEGLSPPCGGEAIGLPQLWLRGLR